VAGAVPRQLGPLKGSFDETFTRMWEFYLAYCEAGFRVGHLGVSRLGLARAPL
jgi:cyclopropane-fatty-acyl-phospholipid synthase